MPQQQVTWRLVLRLVGLVTGVAGLVVVGGGSALWWVERSRPDATIRTWPDALWFALTTLTTVGYGDHVPVTTVGRLVAAAIMVLGVAVIGAVAAVVALAVARRVAVEEERDLEAEADRIEHRLEVRLARMEAQLTAMAQRRDAGAPPPDGGGSGLSGAGG
jgi:voltage-gated potassium channel Kch